MAGDGQGPPPDSGAGAGPLPRGVRKELLRPAAAEGAGAEGAGADAAGATSGAAWGRPKRGDECTVHYVGRLEADGREFDSSRAVGRPLTFTLGVGQAVKGWDLAVATMRAGEVAAFTCAPEYAYGEQGAPNIPRNATLVFEIELLSFRRAGDVLGDGSCWKTTLRAPDVSNAVLGTLDHGAKVLCSVKAMAADGAVLHERRRVERQLGVPGSGGVCEGLPPACATAAERALAGMGLGEAVSLACPEGVSVEVELHGVFEVEDPSPSKDGSVSLRRLRGGPGDGGQRPRDGAAAVVAVEAAADARGAAVPGLAPGAVLHFIAGNGDVCDALEFAVLRMGEGERTWIRCCPAAAASAPTAAPPTAATEQVSITVVLLEFENGLATWEMAGEEKITFAAERKEVGNKLFKAQRYRLALARYAASAALLRSHAWGEEAFRTKAGELESVCEANCGACFLRLGEAAQARRACDRALEAAPRNPKALFRRAIAEVELGDFCEAVRDVRQLLASEPQNQEARRLLQQALNSARRQGKETATMFSKMHKAFDGFADEEGRRVKEGQEAHEAELARRGMAARAEAARLRAQGGAVTAERAREDLERAQATLTGMQSKIREMEMDKWKEMLEARRAEES